MVGITRPVGADWELVEAIGEEEFGYDVDGRSMGAIGLGQADNDHVGRPALSYGYVFVLAGRLRLHLSFDEAYGTAYDFLVSMGFVPSEAHAEPSSRRSGSGQT